MLGVPFWLAQRDGPLCGRRSGHLTGRLDEVRRINPENQKEDGRHKCLRSERLQRALIQREMSEMMSGEKQVLAKSRSGSIELDWRGASCEYVSGIHPS